MKWLSIETSDGSVVKASVSVIWNVLSIEASDGSVVKTSVSVIWTVCNLYVISSCL